MQADRLEDVFRRVFAVPDLVLTDDTPFDAIPGWGSLSYVNVVYDIEQTYNVRFSDAELEQLYDVASFGALKAVVDAKLGARV